MATEKKLPQKNFQTLFAFIIWILKSEVVKIKVRQAWFLEVKEDCPFNRDVICLRGLRNLEHGN